jgi:hypothetical protein
MNKVVARIGLAGVLVAVLTGCVSAPEMDTPAQAPANQESVEQSIELELPEGSSAGGVVLAALLLSNGDITRAVEEGLVTPEEVELALAALAEGNLQAWVDAAEQ